jgi:4-amino-4-deoxy-L-arabinose transferase-like glycosyltransferase
LLLAYGVALYFLVGAVPGGSDTSGYFNEARLFSRLRIHADERALPGIPAGEAPPYLYVPLGFRPAADGSARMVPTYPPGLPLLLIPAARVAGWRHAGDLLLILHSLAGIALTFALGRLCGLSAPWSLLASAVLAASPLYLYMSLWALSDVPATAWATAAVIAAWKGRERPGWVPVSGICVAVAFLVRPTNFLILAPVVLAIGMSPWRLAVVALGSLPGVAVWMGINHAAFGGYLQSGYGAIGNEFHSGLVYGTLAFCVRWLPVLLSPIVVVSPGILAFLRARPRVAAVLASWAAVYIGFYLPYRWTQESWWFLRFLLPAAPALIVAGLVVLQQCFDWLRRRFPEIRPRALPALLLFVALVSEASQIGPLGAWAIGRGERKYGRVADWLGANVPRNSAVIAYQFSGALFYYTNLTLVRPDQMDRPMAERVRASTQSAGMPLYAVLFPFELGTLKAVPGPWARVGSVDDVTIWRWDLAKK